MVISQNLSPLDHFGRNPATNNNIIYKQSVHKHCWNERNVIIFNYTIWDKVVDFKWLVEKWS